MTFTGLPSRSHIRPMRQTNGSDFYRTAHRSDISQSCVVFFGGSDHIECQQVKEIHIISKNMGDYEKRSNFISLLHDGVHFKMLS